MEMMVVIPIEAYNAMLVKCDSTRAEYALLKNGVVTRNREGNEEECGWRPAQPCRCCSSAPRPSRRSAETGLSTTGVPSRGGPAARSCPWPRSCQRPFLPAVLSCQMFVWCTVGRT